MNCQQADGKDKPDDQPDGVTANALEIPEAEVWLFSLLTIAMLGVGNFKFVQLTLTTHTHTHTTYLGPLIGIGC